MYKILLIGAGQLGSRYLQGLANLSIDVNIEVVEPYEGSVKIAKERFAEMPQNDYIQSLKFFNSIEKTSFEIDLAIIATSSNVRFKVLEELLNSKKVNNLLLEKVLFQSLEEYEHAQKLIDMHNVSTWVNHPRRMYPFYKKLQQKLVQASQVHYEYKGGDWGLGCNSLHYIDHLSFLMEQTELKLNTSYLDNILYPAKRSGFFEFNGTLLGSVGEHTFSLTSLNSVAPGILSITSDILCCNIDENNGHIYIAEKSKNWKWETKKEKIIYFQSELTAQTVEDIIINHRSVLPKYKDAMLTHSVFIKALLNKMNEINGQENKICPIT